MSLTISHVTKSFGATRAVDGVSFAIGRGEIVGLIGENGAGKTTLMRIVAGEIAADSGTIAAPRAGIVHQHFALVSHFTIAQNLALVRERRWRFVSNRTLEREAEGTVRASGIDLRDVSRRASELSVGERAKLELIKAVASNPELLILDDPTSVLTPVEAAELFALMRRLAANGTAIVFITHKIPEVMEVAERLVVMRRGRVVADTRALGMTAEEIARAMVEAPPSRPDPSLTVGMTRGEILAIVGVAGNGQRELADSLLTAGAGFIPEDRAHALIAQMSIAENLALRRVSNASEIIAKYSIKASGPDQLAGTLSGGNQQKVILARELERHPALLVAAEPTRGLDIEATRFVHDRLRDAVGNGAKVVLITSDLDEAFALADEIQVIYRGELSARMTRDEARPRVAQLMAGLS